MSILLTFLAIIVAKITVAFVKYLQRRIADPTRANEALELGVMVATCSILFGIICLLFGYWQPLSVALIITFVAGLFLGCK